MLINLQINDILLISQGNINFAKNLNIITGETGAGKSIVLDSILFAIGAPASVNLIRHNASMAVVCAEFEISLNLKIKQKLDELAIDYENSIIIRRIITKDGKTKNYLNDISINLATIRELAAQLIEIHLQTMPNNIFTNNYNLELIDLYGGQQILRDEVNLAYLAYKQEIIKYNELQQQIEANIKERDYLSYVVNELTNLNPQKGEEQALGEKRILLMNSAKIISLINTSLSELNSYNLQSLIRNLTRNEIFYKATDSIEQASNNINETIDILETIKQQLEDHSENLEAIETRLFALKAAARKYNVTCDELIDFLATTEGKLTLINKQQENIDLANKHLKLAKDQYVEVADSLSKKRKIVAENFVTAILKELTLLKLPKAKFNIIFEQAEQASYGIDKVSFLFSSNPGMEPSPIAKIASGGELSRFMLAVKLILSHVNQIKCLIFDEIDTGIGGAVADAVGLRLVELAKTTQVIVITHHPQIAAKANCHIFVTKQQTKLDTTSTIKILNPLQQQEEIARMLSGEIISDEAREAAKKLIKY